MGGLRKIFRPHQRKVWLQLCEEIGADFIPGKGLKGRDRIRAYYEEWIIIIDTFREGKRMPFTRIRAPYVNRDSFQFRLFRDNAANSIAKVFGMQDVVVGHKQFDKEFVIQGNDEQKLKMMFSNQLIRQLIAYQSGVSMKIHLDKSWVTDEFNEGISELYLEIPWVVDDLDQLLELYDLFAEVLHHLCHIGSAYEDDPFLKRGL